MNAFQSVPATTTTMIGAGSAPDPLPAASGRPGRAPRVAAVVLAAGAATRFGGPKQLADMGGEPMVARVVRQVMAVSGLASVVVVVGAHGDAVAAALPGLGEVTARCAAWTDGIGASIACGLAAAGPLDAALVVLGDQPLVDSALIQTVLGDGLRALAGNAVDAARPIGPSGAPGHPVLLGPAALLHAAAPRGDHGVLRGLDPSRILSIPTDGPASTFDVDAADDLVVARELVRDADQQARAAARAQAA